MTVINRKQWLMIFSALTLIGPCIFAAGEKEKPRTVTVQGQGKMVAVPDVATLMIEVSLEGTALDAVSADVRERMQKALATLKSQGIDDKDIQTLSYQMQPRYDYDKAGNAHRKGYRVANRVSVKVHELKKVGKILTAVLDSGVTTVNGPDFDFDNPEALERQTLMKAVEDAKMKAALLAKAAGASLGEVLTIDQNGFSGPPGPRPLMARGMMAAVAGGAEEPIAVGEQRFTSTVTLTFALQ